MRGLVLREGYRADGRALHEVRPITCRAGALPRTHGSALFTRGETQAIAVTTLGVLCLLLCLLLWLAEVERRQHGRDLAFSKTSVPYQERPPGIPSADAVLLDLAEACSLASVQDLCDCHAVSLLEDCLVEPAGWGLSSPGWLATCALLRRVSADGLRGAWPTLSGSLLGVASSQDQEPRLRLDVMELLDALLEVSR